MAYKGLIYKYRHYLPKIEDKHIISLYEGNTPLINAPGLEKEFNLPSGSLYLKIEGLNPTGSFKDRGMTMAVSKAVESGSRAIITASTGNTSASAAAFASRAGIKCVVLVPDGKIALGKLSQALIHGAQVFAIDGNFDEALQLVKEISQDHPITLVNSVNPMRLEGQKTGAFEIVDELGREPDYHFIPVGNAGNISAYWMGYKVYFEEKKIHSKPKMMGFQASGAAPIVEGKPIKNPTTLATAIRIGNPASWKKAEAARDESNGVIDKVTDEEIMDAYKLLAQVEGVYCEPASAASVAGLKKYSLANKIKLDESSRVVCVLTGHGLKDPDTAISSMPKPIPIKADKNAILEKLVF